MLGKVLSFFLYAVKEAAEGLNKIMMIIKSLLLAAPINIEKWPK